jgi:hypothetical protein
MRPVNFRQLPHHMNTDHNTTNTLPSEAASDSHCRHILPVELVIRILELSLNSDTWHSRATQLNFVLLVNRAINAALVKPAYFTVILKSINAVELFFNTLEASSHLAGFVINLWIATPRLNQFDTSNYAPRMVEAKICTILSKTRSLKRVTVPYEYFPSTGFPRIKHLTTTNNLFPPAIPTLTSLEALHVHGLPNRNCVNTIISRFVDLRSLVIDVFSAESDPNISVLCARMVLLFRQRLKNMVKLEMIANASVINMLRMGLKKTLEEDSRINLQERGGDLEDRLATPPFYDIWLMYYGQQMG